MPSRKPAAAARPHFWLPAGPPLSWMGVEHQHQNTPMGRAAWEGWFCLGGQRAVQEGQLRSDGAVGGGWAGSNLDVCFGPRCHDLCCSTCHHWHYLGIVGISFFRRRSAGPGLLFCCWGWGWAFATHILCVPPSLSVPF